MDEMCGRGPCGVDPISAFFFFALVWAGAKAMWDRITGKNQPAPPPEPSQQEIQVNAAEEDFRRRNYEATKLVYRNSAYAKQFHQYPAEVKTAHLAKVAEFVDELAQIEADLQQATVAPVGAVGQDEIEEQSKRRRRDELLAMVYRDPEQ